MLEATIHSQAGSCEKRQAIFEALKDTFEREDDSIRQYMAKVMRSFKPGLFVGGDDLDPLEDNLDLERWFKQPKGHERRINGRHHAGVRLVQEGPTLMLALDAHQAHPTPFTREDIRPYCEATPPSCQGEAIHRRKIMRNARSRKKRRGLLTELESRYFNSS